MKVLQHRLQVVRQRGIMGVSQLMVLFSHSKLRELQITGGSNLGGYMATLSDGVRAEIPKIMHNAKSTGAIVAAWEELKELLEREKLAWYQQAPPEHVGCHKSNRSGEGVGAMQSHNHGYEICMQGWSWRKASDAVAVEYVGDEESKTFNEQLVALSDGMFPPLASMTLLSISASHTNAFLRSVKAESKSACPKLADSMGFLNKEAICMNRGGLRQAIERGLNWLVLSNAVVKEFPDIIDMVQKAMNTRAHENQSEFEVLLSIFQKPQGSNNDWDAIERSAAFSNPPCKDWLGELCKFVRQHGGDGKLLEDLNLFSRTLGSLKDQTAAGSKKMMGSEFWSKLNNVKWAIAERKPWVLIATVKANLASPPHKVVDGYCKLIEARHISALMGKENREKVSAAEALMTDARAVVNKLEIPNVRQIQMVGKLDVRCIWHIMKLGKAGEGKNYDSIAAIGQALQRHACGTMHYMFISRSYLAYGDINMDERACTIFAIRWQVLSEYPMLQHRGDSWKVHVQATNHCRYDVGCRKGR